MATRSATVRFYRLARFDELAWPADPIPLLMSAAPAAGGQGVTIKQGKREYLVERSVDGYDALMISSLRAEALFAVARDGVTHPLDLDDDETIAMQTHIVFLPGIDEQRRVVGLIRSNVTPGYLQVSNVLTELSRSVEALTGVNTMLHPLVRDDPAAMVRISESATKLTVRFAEDQANVLAAASTVLGENGQRIARMTGIRDVEVSLRFTEDGGVGWRERIADLANAIGEMVGTKPAARASIIDEDGQSQIVDLLSDELVRKATVDVPDDEPRTLSPETAANLIAKAYNDMVAAISNSVAWGD
jgi:hypothetical protein